METQAALRMFLTLTILCVFYNGDYGRASPEIDIQLKALNKPALKTIKSEDGDIIGCVDIYKQPAFDHPALKNHKIQMEPSVELFPKSNSSSKLITSQIWTKSGSCPVGTVPIRRVSREDIKRASSPSRFGRKSPRTYSFLDNALQHNKTNFNLTAEKLRIPIGGSSSRGRVQLCRCSIRYKCLEPPGVQYGDHSSAQIWLLAGESEIFESIEAGWMVNPRVFGDNRTRLFTYRTDPNKGNWWLFSQDTVLGYWPAALFKDLSHSATAVGWGGVVYSPNVRKKPHTKTPMGSGSWASTRWGSVCFHTNIRIKDYSLQIKYPQYLSEFSDEYNCYSTLLNRKPAIKEPYFYFGGPGQNSRCP